MPTITMTFVRATHVLATFTHSRNISAITDPILTQLEIITITETTTITIKIKTATHSTTKNNNNKSNLLLTWIGPSFKVKFLDQQQQQKNANRQRQYITYYWHNFDQTLKLGFCYQQS